MLHGESPKAPSFGIDLGLMLSLIALLGGLWLYLHAAILNLTLTAPSEVSVVPLGVIHWFVTVYLLLALFVLYRLGSAEISHAPERDVAERVLLNSWPAPFLAGLMSLGATRAVPDANFVAGAIPGMTTFAAGMGIIWLMARSSGASFGATAIDPRLRPVLLALVLGALPFMIGMGFLMSGVEIRTDKEFYQSDDAVMVSVRPAGYIFRPNVRTIEFGASRKQVFGEGTFIFAPKEHSAAGLIIVHFAPQLPAIPRRAYHAMRMVK